MKQHLKLIIVGQPDSHNEEVTPGTGGFQNTVGHFVYIFSS